MKKTPETKQLEISNKMKIIQSEFDYKDLANLPNLIESEFKLLNSLELDMDIKYPYSIHIQKNITSQEATLVFDSEKYIISRSHISFRWSKRFFREFTTL